MNDSIEYMLTLISIAVSEDGVYRVLLERSAGSVQRKNTVRHDSRSVYSQLRQLITNKITDTSELPRSHLSFKQARSNTNVCRRVYEQSGWDITQHFASYAMAPSEDTGIAMYLRSRISWGVMYQRRYTFRT